MLTEQAPSTTEHNRRQMMNNYVDAQQKPSKTDVNQSPCSNASAVSASETINGLSVTVKSRPEALLIHAWYSLPVVCTTNITLSNVLSYTSILCVHFQAPASNHTQLAYINCHFLSTNTYIHYRSCRLISKNMDSTRPHSIAS